jgi:glucose-6-phosphate dehydrogenase assembly protein OpcA
MISTGPSTDSFLEGQGIPVELPNIETELAKLWGPAAEQAGGPELDNPHVTRIVLANLVVACLNGDGDSFGPVLETVIARFPCRAIVLLGSDDAARRINAEVSALCHLPAPGLPQVCSERIVLRVGANAVDLVPGAVRPLLEADLPMVLWWTGDPRAHEVLFRDLADECARLVLDLPDPGAAAAAVRLGLDRSLCPFSRDSSWFGITRWRELIAQFFDPPGLRPSLLSIATVEIEVLSVDASRTPRLAIWLAAWLAGQLGWKSIERPRRLAAGAEAVLTARFASPSHEVTLKIVTRPPEPSGAVASPQIARVTIRSQRDGATVGETFEIHRPVPDSPVVLVEAEACDACRLPRLIELAELDPACRIAAALESSRVDPPFDRAVPIALWLLEADELPAN